MRKLLCTLFVCIMMPWGLSFGGEAEITEAARPILEAANKPLDDFAQAVVAAQLPDLPAPGTESSSPTMTQVRDVIWKRVSKAQMIVGNNDKKSRLDEMKALCVLRAWILKHKAYSNLVIASFIDKELSTFVVALLANGKLETGEAKGVLAALEPRTKAGFIVEVAAQQAPNSRVLKEFKAQLAENGTGSLLDLANSVSEELNELIDERPSVLMANIRPASLISFASQASGTSHMAQELAGYAAKGGDLNAEYSAFMKAIKDAAPEGMAKEDPALLIKFNAAMYAAFLENVKEWKAKH